MSREKGKFAEKIVVNYLIEKKYHILEENYNCPLVGEIDIIAQDGFFLVFIEVKYSENDEDYIFEKINTRKQQRLVRSAQLYIQRHKIDLFCRFDAVFILKDRDLFRIEHFENIITDTQN